MEIRMRRLRRLLRFFGWTVVGLLGIVLSGALLADYRGGGGPPKPSSARADQAQIKENIDDISHRP